MKRDLKEMSIRQFADTAEKYDQNANYDKVRGDYQVIKTEMEREAFTDVLDCGCGTGAFIDSLLKDHPQANCTGLDITAEMIAVAKRKEIAGASFLIGDSEDLPFDDDSFDVIVCAHSFHHYPRPDLFMAGARRVLRPGGRLIIRDNTGSKLWNFYMNHWRYKRLRRYGLGDVRVYSEKDLLKLCAGSGLLLESFAALPGRKLHAVIRRPR